MPKAKVMAYQQYSILWEKLTALHQFSTQTKEPNLDRLARHWYDVNCLINTSLPILLRHPTGPAGA
ncbi:nucleotidyl transferase AbiEii/AbiGii toxin family protein [Marinomonas arctica]|uniref:nucleotidyl transferase AbiEii/AbiGii toxin family protein n=1 Tax=Marinomonas arctica TaxID=383750 RepID=UPI003571252A